MKKHQDKLKLTAKQFLKWGGKRYIFLCLSIFFLLSISVSSAKQENIPAANSEYKLWYLQPAKEWVEALPVGNGRLGAMVFGGVYIERIQLNEESLWAGKRFNTKSGNLSLQEG